MRAAKLIMAALIAIPVGALAQNESPQSAPSQAEPPQSESSHAHATPGRSALEEGQTSASCISNITFSHEFLERYPRAGAACREVKVESGTKWARFDADVVRVRRNRVTANFIDRHNRDVGTITFDASPDARVEVNGRPMRFSHLKRGDKLSFWMPESRVGFYAEPGASESTKLAVVGTAPPRR